MSIERPTEIKGYEHPKNSNYSKKGVYKTFSDDPDETVENCSEFSNTETGKQYASLTIEEEEGVCYQCKGKIVKKCPCGYSDKQCENGHKYYTDRDGTIRLGDPHVKSK